MQKKQFHSTTRCWALILFVVEQNVHRDEGCAVQNKIHGLEVEIKCKLMKKCKNRKNNYMFVTHNADCDFGTTNYIQKVNFCFSVFSARINTVSSFA